MKRLFIILTAAVMAVGMMAENIIPSDLLGIKLGYTVKKDVDMILKHQGLEYVAVPDDSTNYVYVGSCRHEGMDFGSVVTRYVADTVVFLGLYKVSDRTETNFCKDFIERIHSKYDHLPKADTTLWVMMLTSDAKGMESWSRKDDKNLIVTFHNDTLCSCVYFAAERVNEIMVNELTKIVIESSPDYAEVNKVTGVAGVKFGDSKEYVKRVMSSKNYRLLDSDDHSILYIDARIGGTTYDFARFYFKSGEGLVAVNLQKAFYDWKKEEAEMCLKNIVSLYGGKYTNLEKIKDEEDSKLYKCGSYIDGYKYPPIFISFSKSLSRGGNIMYYVQVDYYEMRIKTLYDDEI